MSANIFAVIHARSQDEAHANADLAVQCGCDGVFFISHGELSSKEIIDIARNYDNELAQVGVNLLGTQVTNTVEDVSCGAIEMLWSDYTPVDSEHQMFEAKRKEQTFPFIFYGGIAFKYQPQPRDLFAAAYQARDTVDILTTSGVGTGFAPDLAKLETLAEGFGMKIAVASGVTPENAVSMLPFVDHFLVATGISKNFHTIDEDKCKALVNAIRSAE
jgi:hypothetical protein